MASTASGKVRPRKAGSSPSTEEDKASKAREEKLAALKHELRAARKQVVLWKKPLATLFHFVLELGVLLFSLLEWVWNRKFVVFGVLSLTSYAAYILMTTTSPELQYVAYKIKEAAFWCFLGILSSVGLGTGLHTFILFLGPYIAHVTMHAYACGTLDFGPQIDSTRQSTWSAVDCPPEPEGGWTDPITILAVISKIRYPAMMWGAGTAIGELPPYFVARAARLSGEDPDDEDLEEFHETLKDESANFVARTKRFVHNLVQRAGFWGIFACAAIPNPLFDLAGITCGHFLIPFTTFFSATVLGKAVVKVHIQVFILVTSMSKPVFNGVLDALAGIPLIGPSAAESLREMRASTEAKFMSNHVEEPKTNLFAVVMAVLVIGMIAFFLVSIINQLAQRNVHRQDKKKLQTKVGSLSPPPQRK
ncbi:hypothetical protein PTSG_06500 [Salpingoeca rosetta]|uniref:Vacuole membrane protein 1 n=1 Tax=Salpingoeca rosetta (strain ATCC 50818 / BSB-021) TaxID=946362 RepID=F2UFZ6_SALR5|nr:uncharacterized protein PTSG_06500 [Salpingoeca rosetta]EGD75424.1 hypothetical protein PTSG_06500 [Salpingoeca rosetta]|eukprot:XP_004991881.1 hypothetical protein PTSG_06500 [Salpingoeca rosetta]